MDMVTAETLSRPRSASTGGAGTVVCYCVCGFLLLWPAFLNGYPLVFADTGTYLHQAMHRSLGWDRPPFYSLAIFPLHQGMTTWPVIVAQAGLAVWVLDLTRRAFSYSRAWLAVLTVIISTTTWFPWIVSELMPDLFTPLMILILCALVFAPERFGARERLVMTGAAGFMIASQQSSVLLSCALLGVLLPLRRVLARSPEHMSPASSAVISGLVTGTTSAPCRDRSMAQGRGRRSKSWLGAFTGTGALPLLAPALAVLALLGVNMAGHGRMALSPYGNVFLLARVIYDGPGMTVLRRECPGAGWRLCPYLDRFPSLSDEFLWNPDSPILRAGGHKAISAEAGAIIHAALTAEPGRALRAAWNNTLEQLVRFESGDGLDIWDAQAGAVIDRDFPLRERAAYHAARQQQGLLLVPFAHAHEVLGVSGVIAAALLLAPAWRRRHPAAGFLAASLLALPLSAAITGALSTPHDRYQSRILWLPTCAALLSAPALLSRRP